MTLMMVAGNIINNEQKLLQLIKIFIAYDH